MSWSANVLIGKSRRDQQMSGSANVHAQSANGRLAKISKCLSQQMSMPSQQMSRQQMSVSKSPVGKCQIGIYSHTNLCIQAFFSTVLGQTWAAEGCPYVEFWGKIWVFCPFFEFFHRFLLNKSCPYFEFLDKNGFEFLPGGQKLSFFRSWVFAEMLKKSLL